MTTAIEIAAIRPPKEGKKVATVVSDTGLCALMKQKKARTPFRSFPSPQPVDHADQRVSRQWRPVLPAPEEPIRRNLDAPPLAFAALGPEIGYDLDQRRPFVVGLVAFRGGKGTFGGLGHICSLISFRLTPICGGAFMQRILVVGLALLLVGCANRNWQPGPNVNPSLTFEQQEARCRMMARHGGTAMAAAGDPAFVAGAAVGHGISGAANAAADFNDCMQAAGYVKAGQ